MNYRSPDLRSGLFCFLLKTMAYYIDLRTIPIEELEQILDRMDVLPSWEVLFDQLPERISILRAQGILDFEDLFNTLKNKQKLERLSDATGIPLAYLNVLRRMLNTYRPKPNRLKDFPNMPLHVVEQLENNGIRNTLELYRKVITPADRYRISEAADLDPAEVLRLAHLADLSRIRWVNHTFAYALNEAGFDTAQQVAESSPKELYERVKELNDTRQIYNATIGERDMARCIDSAKTLDQDLVY